MAIISKSCSIESARHVGFIKSHHFSVSSIEIYKPDAHFANISSEPRFQPAPTDVGALGSLRGFRDKPLIGQEWHHIDDEVHDVRYRVEYGKLHWLMRSLPHGGVERFGLACPS